MLANSYTCKGKVTLFSFQVYLYTILFSSVWYYSRFFLVLVSINITMLPVKTKLKAIRNQTYSKMILLTFDTWFPWSFYNCPLGYIQFYIDTPTSP